MNVFVTRLVLSLGKTERQFHTWKIWWKSVVEILTVLLIFVYIQSWNIYTSTRNVAFFCTTKAKIYIWHSRSKTVSCSTLRNFIKASWTCSLENSIPFLRMLIFPISTAGFADFIESLPTWKNAEMELQLGKYYTSNTSNIAILKSLKSRNK